MLTLVCGGIGNGKTLFLTNYALQSIDEGRYKHYYANFKFNHPKVKTLTHQAFLGLEKEESALVLITEIYGILDSRTSSSKRNRAFSYMIFQSRKNGMDIMADAQLLSSVDLRLRRLAELKVMCRALPNSVHPRKFRYDIYKEELNGYKHARQFLSMKQAEKVFPFYDTKEIINFMDGAN